MTPDPYFAKQGSIKDPSRPQSWNRYAYVLGDPINSVDPRGLFECEDPQYEGCGPHPSGPPLDPFCPAGEHFSPSQDDCVPNGAPPPGAPPPPPQPTPPWQCDIGLYEQSVSFEGDPLKHTYIQVGIDVGSGSQITIDLEAGPSPNLENPSSTATYLNNLNDLPNAGHAYNNTQSNLLFETGFSDSNCTKAFYPQDTYYYGVSYNSNSFTYSLFVSIR